MSVDDYRWHYDYARLAWDSGFTFQNYRTKPALDKNIGHIDVEQVIRERDVATVERNIGTIIEFSLDNDQTSILDPSFVKIFRLSQLSVQYLLFCKQYLDNTVVLVKKEFVKNNEEAKNLKRYVDELKQEAANSKKQIKELKSALGCQIASIQNMPVFQCTECPKAFSTEEYLLAHIKRRHESHTRTTSTSFQAETDKLQLEIKELKERLNNTEKFIHNDELGKIVKDSVASNLSTKNNSTENVLLTDLQQKFELLKNHVENELRILQTQKFDPVRYEKWFETFLSKLEHSQNKIVKDTGAGDDPTLGPTQGESDVEKFDAKKPSLMDTNPVVVKNDTTTQTDIDVSISPEPRICKNCQARRSPVFRATLVKQSERRSSFSDNENAQQKIRSEAENHLEKFEEMLQEKVTGSIEKLENQMQSFWNKMNEMEKQKLPAVDNNLEKQPQNNSKSNTSIETIEIKPQKVVPKPRKNLQIREAFKSTVPRKSSEPSLTKRDPKSTIQMKLHKHASTGTITIKNGVISDSKSESESETSEDSVTSESSDSDSDDNRLIVPVRISKPSNTSILGQRSLTSLKEAAFTPEVLQGLQKEVENILNNRLEEIGVSPEWSHLPVRSYQRALNIVTHQAALIQKNVANYMHIRGQILKNVDQQVAERKNATPPKHSKLRSLLSNVKSKAKTIVHNEPKYSNKPVNIKTNEARPHSNKNKVTKTQEKKVQNVKEDKPKTMYTTDTESDVSIKNRKINTWNQPKITDQTQKAYFDVIQEFNTTVNTKMKEHEVEAIPEKEQQPLDIVLKDDIEEDNHSVKAETQAKGVLKNYPSVGSLQKKKVLFDLESSDTSAQKEPEKPPVLTKSNEGGSTTSVASSILDGNKTNIIQKGVEEKQNVLSDLSDFDFNDVY